MTTMTIVISELNPWGIAMIGDSAVTIRDAMGPRVREGAAKIHYSPTANIGFAIWGGACVDGKRMDFWMADFLSSMKAAEPLPAVADRLAAELNQELVREGKAWGELRRGIHVAGYHDGLPTLYHIHTGDPALPQHELRVFKDFPDGTKKNRHAYLNELRVGTYHLRNGYYKMFGPLFDAAYKYSQDLHSLGFKWPYRGLEDRVTFFSLLTRFLADTLAAADFHPGVNATVSAIGFTEAGLQIDKRLQLIGTAPCTDWLHGSL
jgi:hypothetical protein